MKLSLRGAICSFSLSERKNGRGERIRTSDPLVPNQVLYQAEPLPELVFGRTFTAESPWLVPSESPANYLKVYQKGEETGAPGNAVSPYTAKERIRRLATQ
jgi:hypothetical protein